MIPHHLSTQHFIGVGSGVSGDVIPLFANVDDEYNALDHHAAVVSAARQGPILPAMFGSPLGVDHEQLRVKLAQRGKVLGSAISASAELIEMGVRVTWIGSIQDQTKPERSGRSFLQAAAKRAQAETAFVESVDVLQSTVLNMFGVQDGRLLGIQGRVAKIALLVQRQQAFKIASKIETFASDAIEINVSGPWPLYSFGVDYVLGTEVLP
jgi:Gas vesicle synthesis protein GvpL/GvpF